MAESIAIARAIEVAEHNGCWEGSTLVVFDATKNDRYYGVRLEVEYTTGVPGWRACCSDGVGKAHSVWAPLGKYTRAETCQHALDGYLNLVMRGI